MKKTIFFLIISLSFVINISCDNMLDEYNDNDGHSKSDTTPPVVLNVTPADKAANISCTTSVSATFNEPMDSGSFTPTSFLINSGAVSGSLLYNEPGNTIIFTPDSELDYNTDYTATITTDVTDVAGNALEEEMTWTFTTAIEPDTLAPVILNVTPADKAEGIYRTITITATFNEPMDYSTFTTSSFHVNSGSVSGSLSYNTLNDTVTFTPDSELDYYTDYTVSITTDVTDASGNALEEEKTWIFKTEQDPTRWIWVSGSDAIDQTGIYGTKGIANPANIPGARCQALSWIDSDDNLWLLGGWIFSSSVLNDLWKFNGTNWTWVSGTATVNQSDVYGTKGVANAANMPGARMASISWIDSDGNLWLFGGAGEDPSDPGISALFNDLWKFDGTNWTWVSGADFADQAGVYGTKGIAHSSNIPGARADTVSWIDADGNLWLFGGFCFDSEGNKYLLNDLWKFDGTNWTWISGSRYINQTGVYGTKGIASTSNIPGARCTAVSWIDADGNLWLFGGYGYVSSYNRGLLNDLWKFDGTNWTWVAGSNNTSQPGSYGTKNIISSTNQPGSRQESVSWIDADGNLWLFGGEGYDSNGDTGLLNDLWKFDGTSWVWVAGSKNRNTEGTYGTINTANPENTPGGRMMSVSWIDSSGNLWLFGGHGIDSDNNEGVMNDLWRFEPVYE